MLGGVWALPGGAPASVPRPLPSELEPPVAGGVDALSVVVAPAVVTALVVVSPAPDFSVDVVDAVAEVDVTDPVTVVDVSDPVTVIDAPDLVGVVAVTDPLAPDTPVVVGDDGAAFSFPDEEPLPPAPDSGATVVMGVVSVSAACARGALIPRKGPAVNRRISGFHGRRCPRRWCPDRISLAYPSRAIAAP